MIARFMLPEPPGSHLIGAIEAVTPGDQPNVTNPCALVRCVPDA